MRLFLISMILFSLHALAEDESPRPLLELGVGGGAGLLPDYPGSDQDHYHYVAFPVFFYHGQIFRSDRDDGARARVVNKPVFGVDVSGSGAFPVETGANHARSGMQSLGWLGEVGPRVYARLLDEHGQLWRVFAVTRPAASIRAGRVYGRGLIVGTGAEFVHKKLISDLTLYAKLTSEFASQEYQDYFYSVHPIDATSDRPEYHARAGYLGTWLSAGLAYEVSDVILSGGFSAISVAGAANDHSPLFRDNLNWSFYVGLAWFFYHSRTPGYN